MTVPGEIVFGLAGVSGEVGSMPLRGLRPLDVCGEGLGADSDSYMAYRGMPAAEASWLSLIRMLMKVSSE